MSHNKRAVSDNRRAVPKTVHQGGSFINERPLLVEHHQQSQVLYSGVLPPPEMLKAYTVMIPDAPERLLRMVEKEGDARHDILLQVTKNGHRRDMAGIICGTIVSCLVIAFAIYCVHQGYPAWGLVLVSGHILAIYSAYSKQIKAKQDKQQ